MRPTIKRFLRKNMSVDLYHGHERPWMKTNKETQKWTKQLYDYVGRNFFFMFNALERRYEFWEHRGPMTTIIFPLTLNSENFNHIGSWNFFNCVKFARRARSQATEIEYMKKKKYKKHTKPSEYIDDKPTEDNSKWKDTSPTVDGVQKVSVPIK